MTSLLRHCRSVSTLGGEHWKAYDWPTALFFPSIVCVVGFVLNFFVWGQKSSGAVPFTTVLVVIALQWCDVVDVQMLALVVLWLGVAEPLVMAGAYFGFRKGGFELPLKVNIIPRPV